MRQDDDHAILISSHITSDLEKVADYITFIHAGKIVFSKTKDDILEQYGVDLEQVQDLHWWKFKAMFDALRPDCLFSKIVEWRSTDLTQVKDPKEKKFIQEMKQVYRLRKSVDEQEKLDLIADALMGGGDLSKL